MPRPVAQAKVITGRLRRSTRLGRLAASVASDFVRSSGRSLVGGDEQRVAAGFHQRTARQLAETLGQLKGLPMKAGQMLSYLDAFVPLPHRECYHRSLQHLQVKARPLRLAEIEQVIRADLGARPADLFARFEPEPIAAASIGQVYRATLYDGREVAVKVQYPGIAEAIRSDLKSFDGLRGSLSLLLPRLAVKRTLSELREQALQECDYRLELHNQQRFCEAWRGDPEVQVPAPLPELSGDRVLVTELVRGRSFAELLQLSPASRAPRLGRIIFRFVFESLYRHGLLNGDPHPGNYVFPAAGTVAFIDFGCVCRYPAETVAALRRLLDCIIAGAGDDALWAAAATAYGLPADADEQQRELFVRYLRCFYAPVAEDRIFCFDEGYRDELAELSLEGVMLSARKALRKGIKEAERPGLLLLGRVLYGLVALLTELGTKANFQRLLLDSLPGPVQKSPPGEACR